MFGIFVWVECDIFWRERSERQCLRMLHNISIGGGKAAAD